MAQQRPKLPAFKTGKCTFKWPHLDKLSPDMGTDDYPKPDGEFNVKGVFDAKAASALKAKLKDTYEAAIAEGKKAYAALKPEVRKKLEAKGGFTANPLGTDVFGEDEQETGEVAFTFKRAASGTFKSGPQEGQKWKASVDVFDASGKPMAGSKIWSGTTGYIAFEASPYFVAGQGAAGLSLRLQAVQVLDLVTAGGGKSASGYGFGAEEGYEDGSSALDAADADTSGEADSTDDDTSDDGSSDF